MVEKVIADLDDPDSELRKAMANVKPLQYVWEMSLSASEALWDERNNCINA
jgi:hypothetical protein